MLRLCCGLDLREDCGFWFELSGELFEENPGGTFLFVDLQFRRQGA
jgi:hypothetical protein